MPAADLVGPLVAGGLAIVGLLLGAAVGARYERKGRVENRMEERSDALRTTAERAARNLRAGVQQVGATLGRWSPEIGSPERIVQCHAALSLVRDDGVSIIASDADGVGSRLFLAHDATYVALQEALAFLERAIELELLDERRHDEQSAILVADADNALRDFLGELSVRITEPNPEGTRRRWIRQPARARVLTHRRSRLPAKK